MAKPTVTKLDDGGYDVQFPEGGRAILSKDEVKSEAEAIKMATERIENSGRIVDDTPETPVGKTTASRSRTKTAAQKAADKAVADADAKAKAKAAEAK